MGRKLGAPTLFGRGLGPHLTPSRPGRGLPPYQVAPWCIQPFGHNRNGPKIGGGSAPILGGQLGPRLAQYGWTEAHLHTKCHDPCSRIIGEGLCPFGGEGAGSPSNTMWPEPRPTCTPSFILIHLTVWPQYINVTDRQTDRQRSDSIGQTVLQTVAQKTCTFKTCGLGKVCTSHRTLAF